MLVFFPNCSKAAIRRGLRPFRRSEEVPGLRASPLTRCEISQFFGHISLQPLLTIAGGHKGPESPYNFRLRYGLGHHCPQHGFGNLLPGKNPPKVSVLNVESALLPGIIAKISLKKQFFQKSGHTRPHDQASLFDRPRTTSQDRLVVVNQRESRDHKHIIEMSVVNYPVSS